MLVYINDMLKHLLTQHSLHFLLVYKGILLLLKLSHLFETNKVTSAQQVFGALPSYWRSFLSFWITSFGFEFCLSTSPHWILKQSKATLLVNVAVCEDYCLLTASGSLKCTQREYYCHISYPRWVTPVIILVVSHLLQAFIVTCHCPKLNLTNRISPSWML